MALRHWPAVRFGAASRPQRLVVIEIRTDTRELDAAKIDHKPGGLIDFNAAAPSTSLDSAEHEHAVAEIANLISEHMKLLPGVTDVTEVGFNALAPPVANCLNRPLEGRQQLEVRRREVGIGVYVTLVVGVYCA
jgi:hypothetical protein